MATTAISFRRGNTEENELFAGVPGEIVADLGKGEVGDNNATIILHTGNGLQGGIRMARNDFKNVDYVGINYLAGYTDEDGHKALMFNDLSNINTVNQSQDQKYAIETTLKTTYNIASTDGSNLDTRKLCGNNGNDGDSGPTTAGDGWPLLAKRTLGNISSDGENKIRTLSLTYWNSNADTYYLAEGYTQGSKIGTALAYADTSNLNTALLAEGRDTNPNRPGDNLAYADFHNVDSLTITAAIHTAYTNNIILQDYEIIENKTQSIDAFDQHNGTLYPSNTALITYVSNYSTQFATKELDNITIWDAASAKEDYYKYLVSISDGGANYQVDEQIATDIVHPDGGVITIIVTRVDSNGAILEANIISSKIYGSASIPNTTYTDLTKGAIFIVRSNTVISGNLMSADLDNSEIKNVSGTNTASLNYDRTYDNNTGELLSIEEVNGRLFDTSTSSTGCFTATRTITDGGVLSKLETNTYHIDSVTGEVIYDTTSSLAISKTKAYLNKNETIEAFNQDHELLNRSEIDIWKQSKPATAVADNIAVFDSNKNTIDSGKEFAISAISTETNDRIWTALAAKTYIDTQISTAVSNAVKYMGTVADETYLPTSGQQNGDLYWITEFSATPPTGMVAGEPGKAIWNSNLSTPAWDYAQDPSHQPDGLSVEYDATQKLKVRVATRANNAVSTIPDADANTPDGGIYVDSTSFVSSSGYVAVPSLSSATSGQILSNNGTSTVWITGAPAAPAAPGVYHLVVDSLGYPSWVLDSLLQYVPPVQQQSEPEPEP